MSRINCSIIKDLMPSYADGILSEESRKAVDEHIASCGECRAKLEFMCSASPIDVSAPDEGAALEIDYLKKNRRYGRRLAGICVAATALLACGLLFLTNYVIGIAGMPAGTDYELNVEGMRVTISGVAEDGCAVSRVRFSEEDGVVSIFTNTVKTSPLFGTDFSGNFTSDEEIKKVILNNSTVWCDISDNVLRLLDEEKQTGQRPGDAQRKLMGLLPNDPNAAFSSWYAAEAFIGIDLWNPFEDADGFIRRNYTSTSGFANTPISEAVTGAAPGFENDESKHVCLFLNRDSSDRGGVLSDSKGSLRVLCMDLAAGYKVGEATVSFRAIPIGRLGARTDRKLRELGGTDIKVARRSFSESVSEEICFELDGVEYQVLVISMNGLSPLESALETVYASLEAAFMQRNSGERK